MTFVLELFSLFKVIPDKVRLINCTQGVPLLKVRHNVFFSDKVRVNLESNGGVYLRVACPMDSLVEKN